MEPVDTLNEQDVIETIGRVDRRVRAVSDRWHAGESLIVGVCSAGLVIGRHEWPQLGWRWTVVYFVCAGVALAIHLWRRRVHRAPSRWIHAVWPTTFMLVLASGVLVDFMPASLSPQTIAVAILPTLPGLAAIAWTRLR
ncbi:hypothetical protein [Virgisporangium aurantiacum]|uniref:Uncharacterized protein n=1 Tax=Virgisporangium aurantiacum TaxID=175570 RepID=A0A8J3Z0B8_9ACTN|nr:hypothetical protein [Virgisporangium aurantiacum]GIJ54092.1 hypothetical protein Vau01_016080 [Virgisporangium aurantiacum]